MKYNKLFVTAALTAAVTLGSCVEEIQVTPEIVQKVYKASMEEMASDDTRTLLKDEADVVWSKGDRIMIFDGNDSGKAFEIIDEFAGMSSGDFAVVEGMSTEGSGAEFDATLAYYPYDEDVEIEYDGYEEYILRNVTFPSEQFYTAESFTGVSAPMVAFNPNGGTTLRFMNVGGLIRFNLTGEQAISRVTLKGNNGELLSGEGTVYVNSYEDVSIEMHENASTEVALVCEPAVQLSPASPIPFYISLPPTEFEYGFFLEVEYTDGTSKSFVTNRCNEVYRSYSLWMPTVNGNVSAAGQVDAEMSQVYEYYEEDYDYETWEPIYRLTPVNEYSQVAIEIKPSSDEWAYAYIAYMDEESWDRYSSNDELLKNYILEEAYPIDKGDLQFPYYEIEDCYQGEYIYMAAMFEDAFGEIGKVAKIKATVKELVYSDIAFTDVESNIVDGILKNSKELRFTPVTNKEASKYKYIWDTYGYYYYSDEELIETILLDSEDAVTVSADELIDGQIVIDGHCDGDEYFFAVVPFDAEGNPGKSIVVYDYECALNADEVITEGAAFNATRPRITLNLPPVEEFYPDGGWGDAAYYGYEDQTEWGYGYHYYYEIGFTVAPAEGTEVKAQYVDTQSYTLGADAATRAGQLWSESLGFGCVTTTEPMESSYKYLSHYQDEPAPAVVLCVSWKDAEGTVYYMDIDVQPELQKLADRMTRMINGESEPVELSVDGKQWIFSWDAMGVTGMLDFGVSSYDYFCLAYDATEYGMEGYVEYIGSEYSVTPADETSGVITLVTYNMFGEPITTDIAYSGLTETSCSFVNTDLMLCDLEGNPVVATVSDEVHPVIRESW